ncbi:MAG: hypothetical protein Crog4KO_05510 [Crocinitomicaceae bacterium]
MLCIKAPKFSVFWKVFRTNWSVWKEETVKEETCGEACVGMIDVGDTVKDLNKDIRNDLANIIYQDQGV